MTDNRIKAISTSAAPEPAGPYSQAIEFGPFLFISGQTPRDASGTRHLDDALVDQVELVMANLEYVARAAGASLKSAVKVTAYLRPEVDVEVFNRIYSKYLGPIPPARTLIISELKTGAVELDAIVALSG